MSYSPRVDCKGAYNSAVIGGNPSKEQSGTKEEHCLLFLSRRRCRCTGAGSWWPHSALSPLFSDRTKYRIERRELLDGPLLLLLRPASTPPTVDQSHFPSTARTIPSMGLSKHCSPSSSSKKIKQIEHYRPGPRLSSACKVSHR